MDITTISTEGLGDRTYVVAAGSTAVVVDPQRDVDRVLDVLHDRGLDLRAVLETHVHNDYVSGGLALARLTGADLVLHAEDPVTFDRRPVRPGDLLDLGDLQAEVVGTPGHTPTHLSYVLRSGRAGDGPAAAFTGGSMLYGTVGRTDLIADGATEGLSRDQHRSVRHLATSLDSAVTVHPTHGFGSFCASAGGGSREQGTIADERRENLACTITDEDEFVKTLMDGFSAHPPYYAHMAHLNLAGPGLPDLSRPAPATGPDLRRRIERGEWVVDLRPRADFVAGHLPGSVNAGLDGSMATFLGWAIPWGTPFSLVGATAEQVAEAQRELVRIGLDRPQAAAAGEVSALVEAAGHEAPGSLRSATFADLADADDAVVVDVRRPDEWQDGHLDGALHVPLEDVAREAPSLPDDAELWVHCASGYRASIAASLIARAGKDVVLVDDDYDDVGDARRPLAS